MAFQSSATGSPPPDNSNGRDSFRPPRSDLNDPLQIGITIVGTTALIGGIGWWLDSLLHTFPILMAIFAALGLFGIIYLTYLRLQAADRKPNNSESASSKCPPKEKD